MFILTLVTPRPEKDFDLWVKRSYPDIIIDDRNVIDDFAVRWIIKNPIDKQVIDDIRQSFKIDVFQTNNNADYKLFLADM